MKLRIHENSLRLRVNRPDIEALRRDGSIEHRLAIAAGRALSYRLEVVDSSNVEAAFAGTPEAAGIDVRLPRAVAERWYADDEVSIAATVAIAGESALELLIEKDFACLVPREGEDPGTYFANPAKAQD